MAHGLNNTILKRGANAMASKSDGKTGIGSRRIFAPQFKLQVLDSYRNDDDCKGNQRATARKYGIHRRQIQKWLQVENNLRNSVVKSKCTNSSSSDLVIVSPEARKCGLEMALRSAEHRQRDDGQPSGNVECERGYGREEETQTCDDAVDKRVPDIPTHQPIPQQQNQQYFVHEWQMHDDTSSTRSTHSHSEVEIFSHCSLSPHSPPFVPIPLYPPVHIPPPSMPVAVAAAVSSPCTTPFCTNLSPLHLPLPLDFTTHSRRVAPSPDSPRGATRISPIPLTPVVPVKPPDAAAPIDLSLKRPYPHDSTDLQPQLQAPVLVKLPAPRITSPTTTVLDIPQNQQDESQIWDLSTKSIKRECSEPIKLFKPYLDHITTDECPNNTDDIKPVIVSSSIHYEDYYTINNNNNIKMEYPTSYSYSPINTDYYPNNNNNFMVDTRLQYNYEDARYHRSIKQRQSYSLDFKLSAIECYYSDAICRGNQRAVASKFKIHRRQVQKWLKQEDQLRQRNDTKPMHIIR